MTTPNMEAKYEHHQILCDSLNQLYRKKNSDYADSFGKSFRKRGFNSAITRMEDKWQRINALIDNPEGQQVEGEAIDDTLFDFANYCLMLVTEIHAKEGIVEGYTIGQD